MRIIIAAIVGGIIMFVWGAAAHTALPTSDMERQALSAEQEAAVLPALAAVTEEGYYMFPDPDRAMANENQASGPIGVLVIKPDSKWEMSAQTLITEFVTNVLAALLAAIIAAKLAAPFGARVILITFLGVIGWLSISVSYWNWDKFPAEHGLAFGIEQGVGWFLSGIAIAAIAPHAKKQATVS